MGRTGEGNEGEKARKLAEGEARQWMSRAGPPCVSEAGVALQGFLGGPRGLGFNIPTP